MRLASSDGSRLWDPEARQTRNMSRKGMPASGPEVPLIRNGGTLPDASGQPRALPTYANCDVWVRLPSTNVASFTGATWRLYAVVNGTRTCIGQQAMGAPTANQSLRVLGARGYGAVDYFEATVQLDPAAGPAPGGTGDSLEIDITTYDGSAADQGASPAPPGPIPPGGGSFYTSGGFVQQAVVSAAPKSLLRAGGTVDPGAAAPVYVQVFDLAAAPGAGAAPKLIAYVGPGGTFSWTWDGMPFLTGIVFATSSTRDTYTASAVVVKFDAEYQ